MRFEHNSWDSLYREPFGAAPAGSEVTIRARGEGVYNVRLRTYNDHETFYEMHPSPEDGSLYEVTLRLPEKTGLLWYDFQFDADGRSYCYGTIDDCLGGFGQVRSDHDHAYQITVYEKEREVPDWYLEGIIYQIFPDRFAFAEWPAFTPVYQKHTVVHGKWSDSPHYFRNEDGSIDYYDFFGGNLPGIIKKLDYLKDLGVSIIYLNPIFDSVSNHKYDTADYHKIAPEFGNEEIFAILCREAGRRGIRIILDGVFNHTGDDSIYFNKYGHFPGVGAYQSENSPYRNWYKFIHWPHDYDSWWGIKTMPDLNEDSPELQDFIFRNKNSVIKKWLRAGASGWRLDVADELPDHFIEGIKSSLLEEKPEAILMGEVWEDASRKEAYGEMRRYFEGKELDSVMNYPFRSCFIDFFLGNIDSRQAVRQMMSLYEHYPRDNFMGNMNLIGSHDRTRILTILGEADRSMTSLEKENYRLRHEDLEMAVKRLKMLSLLQMTFPGVPAVYYADEAGAEGFEDPYNRGTYPWGHENLDLISWYKKVIRLRNSHEVLRKGDWKPLPSDPDLFAFERILGDTRFLILINRSLNRTVEFTNEDAREPVYENLLTGFSSRSDPFQIPPLSALVMDISPEQPKDSQVIDEEPLIDSPVFT